MGNELSAISYQLSAYCRRDDVTMLEALVQSQYIAPESPAES